MWLPSTLLLPAPLSSNFSAWRLVLLVNDDPPMRLNFDFIAGTVRRNHTGAAVRAAGFACRGRKPKDTLIT